MSEMMREGENLVTLPQGRNASIAASAVKCQPEFEEMKKIERQLDSLVDSPRSRAIVWLKYLDLLFIGRQSIGTSSKSAHTACQSSELKI